MQIKPFFLFTVSCVVVLATGGIAYSVGHKGGYKEALTKSTDDTRLWAASISIGTPDVKLVGLRLVGDGAKISFPRCVTPEVPYVRLSRLPDSNQTSEAELVKTADRDVLIARITANGAGREPLAMALLGCQRPPAQ